MGADLDPPAMRPHSKLLTAVAALAAAVLLLAACGGSHDSSTTAASTAAPPAARPSAAQQLSRLVAAGAPGAIVLVNDGATVRVRAAGLADTRARRALRPTDRFRAGSITKTFVATLTLQLAGEGKLSLDDTVEDRLPGVLPYGDTVTIRQLLNMTGGVPNYQPIVEDRVRRGDLERSYAPRDLVALVSKRKPDFAPATSWSYSSTNYVLAGMIVERVTGHRLEDELRTRIFEPAALRHTAFPVDTTAIRGSHALGYGLVDGRMRDLTGLNASAAWATGALVSTASDLGRFWRALLGGDLLRPAQLHAMKQTVPIGRGLPVEYGLGIMRFTTRCGPLWGNGGDIPGYSNEWYNSEDGARQAGVVVNVNPIPKAVSGEPLGVTKSAAIADALRSRTPC
jgi:D-alanyl-D-alanine carboxypeptidase